MHRDGTEAVRLAERARDASARENAVLFSTLAAAYAETGRFDDAVLACRRAIELARRAEPAQDAHAFEEQLGCHVQRKPFHFRR